ncbi:MAG: hypothetical protein LBK47_03135 [Prevotellaceae bacterium]|jgi:hypothetical protein|nr:hypothetical protein [Prevotellaceae bacterium]
MRTAFLFVGTLLVFSACTWESVHYGKEVSCHDPEFDATELSFNAQGGTKSITSKGDFWWMNNEPYVEGMYSEEFTSTRDSIEREVIKIECQWFTIEKKASRSKQLTFTLAPNETGLPRGFDLELQYGDCGGEINVTQSAE